MFAFPTFARTVSAIVLTIALLFTPVTAMAASPSNQASQQLTIDAPPEQVLPSAQQAFAKWSRGEYIETDETSNTVIGLSRTNFFKFVDDITVQLTPGDSPDKTQLNIRSVGRLGEKDFGGNQRNINEYVETLQSLL